MKYTLTHIAKVTAGTLVGTDRTVTQPITDSRTHFDPGTALFVAICGTNHDGHDYLPELYRRGVRAFLVDRPVDTTLFPEAAFIRTEDSLAALQQLAAHHRSLYKGKVVAITGSNGKTITKEWIAQLCPKHLKIFRSPKSYNSQVGVPLSLLMLQGDEKLAIIEAGISQPGEMERLARIIRPEYGILTNIGEAHQESFANRDQKLSEKLLLFRGAHSIIYSTAQPEIPEAMGRNFDSWRLFPIETNRYDLTGFPFGDPGSLTNICLALALYEILREKMPPLLAKLPEIQPVALRLELKPGIGGCKIINDAYNSDINSLSIALDYMASVSGHQPRVLILSDIQQTGIEPEALYLQVNDLLKTKGVSTLIGIGPEIMRHSDLFDLPKSFYPTTEAFLERSRRSEWLNQTILVKGSRDFHFEKISRLLEEKTHTTILEINLDYLISNLNYFRRQLEPGVKIMCMVKALGYGSGLVETSYALQHQGVDYLAVAFADEGVTLREAGITMPIVVLNADSDSFEIMLDYNLEPEIYSPSSLESFIDIAARHGETQYPIHLKLDTGMHRLGFVAPVIPDVIRRLQRQDTVKIRSVFSHLAASDEARHDDFTRIQQERFEEMSSRILKAFPDDHILRHLSNSAAVERHPEARYDMVRLGIGLYGISSTFNPELKVVSTLKTRIVQIKNITEDETVGYGRRGVLDRPSRIATIPIGYADGLNRHLGRGNWYMVVNGVPVPTIGNICMDTCMLDITYLKAKEGDTVIVFGEEARLHSMATALQTIPYEILTGISSRVKRVYIKE